MYATMDQSMWGEGPRPPAWTWRMVGTVRKHFPSSRRGPIVSEAWVGARHSMIGARVAAAGVLPRVDFEAAVHEAYRSVAARLRAIDAATPIRFWNFIPGIGDRMEPGLDRYMVFNAGRHNGFVEWYGGEDVFAEMIATASGVGHDGRDLLVWCLASGDGGVAVENPRQVPAYRYSQQYGPLPPSFARATCVPGDPGGHAIVLVGGTASIRGEATVHPGDVASQCRETLANLASVVGAACGAPDPHATPGEAVGWLARLRELRVYHVHASERAAIERRLRGRFPGVRAIEWVRADLCRPELRVEIEGVAVGSPIASSVHAASPLAFDTLATAG